MRKTMLASTAVLAAGLVVGFTSPAVADQVASDNRIDVPADVAVEVCGNSITVAGGAEAVCQQFVQALQEASAKETRTRQSDGGGVASDNRVNVPADVAVDVCGNSLAVAGGADAACVTVVEALQQASKTTGGNENRQETADAGGTGGSGGSGGSGGGILSGNEVNVPVGADVEVCGNTVSVLGSAQAECVEETAPGEAAPTTPAEQPAEKPADKPAPQESATGGALPVTGAALGGLVVAALATLGGGGAAMFLTRRKKAAAED